HRKTEYPIPATLYTPHTATLYGMPVKNLLCFSVSQCRIFLISHRAGILKNPVFHSPDRQEEIIFAGPVFFGTVVAP
ncbi:MAG: hypothetical protein JW849_00255, partial [Phycisphaerae bacterium]|nr:hypothetical protein [Phycisphaerae bacterium]